MPRVHFVKQARKDNPVAKKGESYYWWKFRFGGKRYSKTRPKRSQLTQSGFLSQLYDLNDRLDNLSASSIEELESEVNDIAEEYANLGQECQDSLDMMPDHLQESSSSGELLQERIYGCEEANESLASMDFEIGEEGLETEVKEELGDSATEEEIEEAVESKKMERLDELIEEAQGYMYEGG